MIGNGPAEALLLQAKPLHLLFEFKKQNKPRHDNHYQPLCLHDLS
jgi:hypothetical protein